MAKPSPDEMIKNLVRDYPVDALEFLKPEITARYGKPVGVSFAIQEIKKHSHRDRNMKNDIAVCYTFNDKRRVVLVLIEHWSDKAKFDIHRFAHYLLDLSKRFPGAEILPVALFTDRSDTWRKQPNAEINVRCFDETYLCFRYQLVRMKDYQAEHYVETKNRFIAVLRSAMRYDIAKKIGLAVECIRGYGYIEEDIRNIEKNIDIIEYFLEITAGEKEAIIEIMEEQREPNMIVQELKKRGYQEGLRQGKLDGIQQGMQQGMQQGKIEAKRETARALLEENMSVEKISKITGLVVDEIEGLKSGN